MLKRIRQTLLDTYPYRIELHAHTTPASPCGRATPEEMVQLYLDAGFDAVVITNHFSRAAFGDISREAFVKAQLSDYERSCKAAVGTKLKVYLGVEVRFDENGNDYLLYGVDGEILGKLYDYLDRGLAAFREEVKLPGSTLIQAHPFRDGCVPAEGRLLDGVEVFNMHPSHNSRNALAALYAKENNIPLSLAGTDFHDIMPGYIAASALRCRELPKDSFALAELLKSGDFILEIGGKLVL
ncbi:MAG: PHP domain-containing protein [Oscillospiraceae bacterium]|nr:PHP domain-containing protein [Oscillospiraceae bacterium]